MMQRVKIVTHSGCDLSYEMAERNNILMLPDLVIFDNEEFKNNIDIFPDTFYDRLEKNATLPTSAHPSLAEFMSAFEKCSDYDEIICIAISSKMSGTINTIEIAANMLAEDGFRPKIYAYDGYQVSFGMGIVALEAARKAAQGASAAEIMKYLDEIVPRIGVYFVMDTLKYAYKGGRIGAIKAVTADALGIKPLLQFSDGTVSDTVLCRSIKEAVRAIAKKFWLKGTEKTEVFVFHAYNTKGADMLVSLLKEKFPALEPYVELVGPVVGIYTGAGCVGIAFIEKEA